MFTHFPFSYLFFIHTFPLGLRTRKFWGRQNWMSHTKFLLQIWARQVEARLLQLPRHGVPAVFLGCHHGIYVHSRSGDWEPQKALKLIQFTCSLCKQQCYSTALGKLALLKRHRPYPGLISEGTAAVPAKDDFQGWRGKTAGSSRGSLCFQHLGRVEAG